MDVVMQRENERGRRAGRGDPGAYPMSGQAELVSLGPGADKTEQLLPQGVFHLLTADDDVASTYGGYVAVCGEVMSVSGLPPSCCPEVGPSTDPRYCPECVREAIRWSAGE